MTTPTTGAIRPKSPDFVRASRMATLASALLDVAVTLPDRVEHRTEERLNLIRGELIEALNSLRTVAPEKYIQAAAAEMTAKVLDRFPELPKFPACGFPLEELLESIITDAITRGYRLAGGAA